MRFRLLSPAPLDALGPLPDNFETRVFGDPRDIRAWNLSLIRSGALEGADLLHVPHFEVEREAFPCPLVLTMHDVIPIVFLRPGMVLRFRTPLAQISWRAMRARRPARRMVLRAARVVTVSQATMRDAVSLLPADESRFTVVENGVSAAFRVLEDRAVLEKVRARLSLPKRFFLYTGGYTARKNVGRMLRAFRRTRARTGADLVLAGAAGERFHDPQVGLHAAGRVEEEDLVALYNLALATLYVSLYEGFGFPVLESLRCGTPVVASNVSSMRDLAPGGCLLVDPYRVDSIEEAMLRMGVYGGVAGAAAEDLRRGLVRTGRGEAERYSWDRAAAETAEVYSEVCRCGG
jgi:glycosyltransferase involved in cell wall biosynthesis